MAPVQASENACRQLELERDKAVDALDSPGPAGYGAETITLGLMRLVEGDKLSDDEQLAAGQIALDACARSGVLEMLKTQVRTEALAEQAQAGRDLQVRTAPGPDGLPVHVPNMRHPANPRPSDPPTSPPGPVVPAVIPGWG